MEEKDINYSYAFSALGIIYGTYQTIIEFDYYDQSITNRILSVIGNAIIYGLVFGAASIACVSLYNYLSKQIKHRTALLIVLIGCILISLVYINQKPKYLTDEEAIEQAYKDGYNDGHSFESFNDFYFDDYFMRTYKYKPKDF